MNTTFIVQSGSHSIVFYLFRVINVGLGYTPPNNACATVIGRATFNTFCTLLVAAERRETYVAVSNCRKVMFSQVSVCPQGGEVSNLPGQNPWADTVPGQTPPGRHPLGRHPPQQMATAADSTHPVGMHSCMTYFYRSGGMAPSHSPGSATACILVRQVKQ